MRVELHFETRGAYPVRNYHILALRVGKPQVFIRKTNTARPAYAALLTVRQIILQIILADFYVSAQATYSSVKKSFWQKERYKKHTLKTDYRTRRYIILRPSLIPVGEF